MARIRTIKPEFFTSADIVSLTPLARLLYIALWCEADKEGRLVWKTATFKLRYLPGDDCDVAALGDELLSAGLVMLYGEEYAVIPAFRSHQHINPRESDSQLPDPDATATRAPRVNHASPRDSDAQGGREGKGKEGVGGSGSRLPPDWVPDEVDIAYASRQGLSGAEITSQSEAFRDFWIAAAGAKGRKADWTATWRTWVRRSRENQRGQPRIDPFAGAI